MTDYAKNLVDLMVSKLENHKNHPLKKSVQDSFTIQHGEINTFLKRPTLARANNIELWYAGGKNVNKLDYADTRGLPIYNSCDWDFDGLFIIYPLVKKKIPNIKLLTPNGIVETEHNSKWESIKDRNIVDLLTNQLDIMKKLIELNQWIIKESNDLLNMLESKN